MSILNNLITTKPGAPRITLFGKPGIGKSTLASKFPSPLFILTEDNELPGLVAFPVANTFEEVWTTVKGLLAEESLPYKTIVIDSISKLDALVIDYILQKEPNSKATTLASACGGYGAGYLKAQSIHRSLKALMDKFKERGIATVYVSHAAVVKHKSPDTEDYDINSIVMNHEKSREVYLDDVDAVLYCKLKSYTTSTDSGRVLVKSTDDRIIVGGISESHVSKNRYSMPHEIPMDFEQIEKYIPFYNKEKK